MEEIKNRIKAAVVLTGFLLFIMIMSYKPIGQIIDPYVTIPLVAIIPTIMVVLGIPHTASIIVWFHKRKHKTTINSYQILEKHTKEIPILKLSVMTIIYSLISLFTLMQLHIINESHVNSNEIDFTILASTFAIYYVIFQASAAFCILRRYDIIMKNRKRAINLGHLWKYYDKKPIQIVSFVIMIIYALPHLQSSPLTLPVSVGYCFISAITCSYLLNKTNFIKIIHENIIHYLNNLTRSQ